MDTFNCQNDDLFVLATDSSGIGLGAVLSTQQGTVVEYATTRLKETT